MLYRSWNCLLKCSLNQHLSDISLYFYDYAYQLAWAYRSSVLYQSSQGKLAQKKRFLLVFVWFEGSQN